ncbi:hypothetical protein HOY80DRAFT_1000437 [Tuber brumale]|nr:hypothetical protein HOY80DRAFT_1000437 [Tuber brumale]
MKLLHRHKPLTFFLPFLFLLSPTPATAQEACVRSCTQNSGINQCRGDIPHDQVAWDVLTAPVHDCYCLSAVKFSGCRPNCTLDGLPENIVNRVMGVWEFVNPVCKNAVEEVSKSAESKGARTGTPEFTAILAEAFHTESNSTTTAAATVTVAAAAEQTIIPTGGNANETASSHVTPPPTVLPSPSASSTTRGGGTNNEGRATTIAISVSLSASFFLAIAVMFWSWARRRRHMRSDQESPDAVGGGMPGDNLIIVVEDPKAQGIKRWVAEQERIKQLGIKMDPDAASETTSTAYTLWTDTELAPTEAGDRERELPPITEEEDEPLGARVTPKRGV